MFTLPFSTPHTVPNPSAMEEVGAAVASSIAREPAGPLFLFLKGELGSGKTTFVQGLARGLGIRDRVLSPTFILLRSHEVPGGRTLHHLDCYRVEQPDELLELGWEAIVRDPGSIVALEWPERVSSVLPKEGIWLEFEQGSHPEERIIRTA